jgi:hypothetical protein
MVTMSGALSRGLALICLSSSGLALAQQTTGAALDFFPDAAAIYEAARQDVTVPLATSETGENGDENAVSIPVETPITPMSCMTAWSFIAGRAIEAPEHISQIHADFSEASASAHWQHWLRRDLDASQGVQSVDFHQRRLVAERDFSLALAKNEESHIFRTLGACYVPPLARELGDPTILLRNFMVRYQGLPDSYTIPDLQRQLRSFPISHVIDTEAEPDCTQGLDDAVADARNVVVTQCFDQGGIPGSRLRIEIETIDQTCRTVASMQCENIP